MLDTTAYQVSGMTCGHCQRAVSDEIRRIPGVLAVNVDLPTGNVRITADHPIDRADVAGAVDEAGYSLVP